MPEMLFRKLQNFGRLSEKDKHVLANIITSTKPIGPRETIVAEGDRPKHSCVLLEGFGCRYKMTSDGRRQILSFQFPGDISDLYSFVMKVMDHNVGTLTNCRIGLIPHRLLQKITEENPHLTRLFWRDTLIDSSSFREWMVGIGRRPARARVAHLLCEILLRFRAIGQGEDHRFNLPLTQSDLADCLGMSLVHINRILQALRQESLIEFGGGTVAITDWERLRELAGFDDAYLHFSNSALA